MFFTFEPPFLHNDKRFRICQSPDSLLYSGFYQHFFLLLPIFPKRLKPMAISNNTVKPLEAENNQAMIWKKILFFSLILVFLLMTFMSFHFGISGDEMDMNSYGKAILNYFTSFGKDTSAIHTSKSWDRDGVLQYYGGFFDLIAAIVNKVSPLEEFTTRHILTAWTGFLAIFFATRLCIRVKGYRMAAICAWLMFLAPFFLGHSMNNPKDIPLATAYIAGIYFFIRFADKFPAVTWKDYIAPIIALGLTIDIRVAGILLIPYMFAWIIWQYLLFKEKREMLRKMIVPVIIISVAGYFFSSLFWPYALQNPLTHPLKALAELSNFKVALMQLYEGERISSAYLPTTYLIHNFFITNSYILIAGLLLAFIFMLGRVRQKEFPLMAFIVFVTIFPVAYIMYKHANVYHAWRHILFIFPSAAIISAYGLDRLLAWAGSGSMRYVIYGLLGIGLLGPAIFIVRTFPNTICYYNIFAGGVKDAYYNYEMDYYFNSLKESVDWFEQNEIPKIKAGDTLVVATNNSIITGYYLRNYPNVKVKYVRFYERSMSDWDFGIFHRALVPADQIQNGSWAIPILLHESTIEGLPLTIVAKRPSHLDYQGFEALKGNHIKEGIEFLLRYHQIDAKNELVNGLLARYYLSINQPDAARSYAMQTLMISPDNPEAKMVLSALNGQR